jgi:uncharacterized repeat protein (TIGR01451 family)
MRLEIRRRAAAAGAAIATMLAGAVPVAEAAGARAGAVVSNAADVTFRIDGVDGSVRTPPAVFSVAEVLQVVATAATPVVTVPAVGGRAVLAFRLVNAGNGEEALRIELDPAASGGDFTPAPATPTFYLDSDGSGSLTAADVPYVPGANHPLLAPDAAALVFAVYDVPAGLPDAARARAGIVVRAVSGSGAPGTVFPGLGDGGVDAVAGPGGGRAAAQAEILVSGYAVAVVKAASVADGAGGTRPEPGARITYEIAVGVDGTGTARELVLRDPIPAATRFVPGSITLDGAPVADAVGFRPAGPPRIELPLGDVAAGTTRRVRFAVLID